MHIKAIKTKNNKSISQIFNSLSEEAKSVLIALYFLSDEDGNAYIENENGILENTQIDSKMFNYIKNLCDEANKRNFIIDADSNTGEKLKINIEYIKELAKKSGGK